MSVSHWVKPTQAFSHFRTIHNSIHKTIHTNKTIHTLLITLLTTPTLLHLTTRLFCRTTTPHNTDSLVGLYYQATQHNNTQTIQQHYNTQKNLRQLTLQHHKAIQYFETINRPSASRSRPKCASHGAETSRPAEQTTELYTGNKKAPWCYHHSALIIHSFVSK